MYTIEIDGRPFFSPIDRALALEAPLLTLEANTIGTLTFTIYPDHPEYGNVRLLRSVLTVRRDGEIISQLRPLRSHMDFQGGIDWTCEELTGLLNDIIRRPAWHNYSGNESAYINSMLTEYGTMRSTALPAGTVSYLTPWVCDHMCYLGCQVPSQGVMELLMWMVYFGYHEGYEPEEYTKFTKGSLVYNAPLARAVKRFQADQGLTVKDNFSPEDRVVLMDMIAEDHGETHPDPAEIEINMTFLLGNVTYVDGTETVEHKSEDYIGFWDLLQRELVEEHEGAYLVPRWSETTCYLDYLSVDSMPLSEQTIKFGENMADLFIDTDSEETFSVLIPIGGESKINIPGLLHPTSPTGPTTIRSVNGGLDYLDDATALATFGRKEITKTWSDITSAEKLKEVATEWFTDNVMKFRESVSLSAYELHYAGVDVEYLRFLTRVPAESDYHALRREYPLSRMEIPLDSPTALNVGLGDDQDRLTDSIMDSANVIKKNYSKLDGRIYMLEHPDETSGGDEL